MEDSKKEIKESAGKQVPVRLSQEEWNWLTEIAKANSRSRRAQAECLLQNAIREALKRQKS